MAMSPRLLRPLAGFHPEAADWRNRVIANEGSVSASTMIACSDFCRTIDQAGLRPKFRRLNLVAGTGLKAALVPLYRGESRTGTQYGPETDANPGAGPFIEGDYVERGSTGGLTSTTTTSKYLNTGLKADVAFPTGFGHLAIYYRTIDPPAGSDTWRVMGSLQDSPAQFYFIDVAFTASDPLFRTAFGSNTIHFLNTQANAFSGSQLLAVTRRSATELQSYQAATAFSVNSSNTTSTPPAHDIYIFAENRNNGSPQTYAKGRFAMYSIGAALSTAEYTLLRSAVDSFQAALERNT